jgi:hypothetical protein
VSNTAGQIHYSLEDWVDFVRDVAPSDRHEAMQRHLAAGCESCGEVHETWTAVLGILSEEPTFEPPAGAVRLARAVYAATKPRRRFAIAGETAKLLFDGQLAAAAGVRTLRPGPRRVLYLYEHEKFLVDLQVEPSKDRAKIVLIGQVTELDKDEPHVTEMQVLLFRQQKLIAETDTNPFGEFSVEFDGTDDDLCLVVDFNHASMVIALSDPRKKRS